MEATAIPLQGFLMNTSFRAPRQETLRLHFFTSAVCEQEWTMYQANYKVMKAHQIPIDLFHSNLSLSLLNTSSGTCLCNYTGWISRRWKLTWDQVSKTFTQTLLLTSTSLRPELAKQDRTLIFLHRETHVNVICTLLTLGTKWKCWSASNI